METRRMVLVRKREGLRDAPTVNLPARDERSIVIEGSERTATFVRKSPEERDRVVINVLGLGGSGRKRVPLPDRLNTLSR